MQHLIMKVAKYFLGDMDLYLAKLDKEGDVKWSKQYGETNKSFENPSLKKMMEEIII